MNRVSRFAAAVPVALLLLRAGAQSQVTVRIDAPTLTVNIPQQRYDPAPIPVTVTVINTGPAPTQPASARIELLSPFALDPSEQSARIKAMVPAVIPPGDSAKVTWLLEHPLLVAQKIQRVTVWVKRGATDSTQHGINVVVPGAGAPDIDIASFVIPDLVVRPDSLGYLSNPFEFRFRLLNKGGTRADSVRLTLQLPAYCELDPPTQQNPIILPVLQPLPIGDPRLELSWTIRYTHATRKPRLDSAVVLVSAKDVAGGAVFARSGRTFAIAGLAPAYRISIDAPDSLQYDATSVYAPKPVPVRVTAANVGLQRASLRTAALQAVGTGVSIREGSVQALQTLAPGDSVARTWTIDVLRGAAPRGIRLEAEVVDADTVPRGAARDMRVPGKPWSLDITDVNLPDSIPLNANRTDYLTKQFTAGFKAKNRFWTSVTVTQTRVTPLGGGVSPNIPVLRTPDSFLVPEQVSPEYTETFRVIGGTRPGTVTFEFLAVSSAGDTGTARKSVFIPALTPLVSIARAGIDSLAIDIPSQVYIPNPFEQRITVSNTGSASVSLDSIAVDVLADGVTRSEARTFIYNTTLGSGKSEAQTWTFTAERRTKSRYATIAYTAWFDKTNSVSDTAHIFIPGFEAMAGLRASGDDTLRFDTLTVYHPRRLRWTAVLRNTGPLPFRLDSLTASMASPALHVSISSPATTHRDVLLQPGDSLTAQWDLEKDTVQLTAGGIARGDIIARFDSGRLVSAGIRVFVPGQKPAFSFGTVSIPTQMLLRPDGLGYLGNPLVTSFRVFNDSWNPVLFSSTSVAVTGDSIEILTPLQRQHGITLAAMAQSGAIVDSLRVLPMTKDRRVIFAITATRGDGETVTGTWTVNVPAIRPTTAADPAVPSFTSLGAAWPNPGSADRGITVPFTLANPAMTRIEVYSAIGIRVAVLADGLLDAGAHLARWIPAVPPGFYILRMNAAGENHTTSVGIR